MILKEYYSIFSFLNKAIMNVVIPPPPHQKKEIWCHPCTVPAGQWVFRSCWL